VRAHYLAGHARSFLTIFNLIENLAEGRRLVMTIALFLFSV